MASDSTLTFLIIALVCLGLFLLLREFWTWFWKINRAIALLEEIRDLLTRSKS